VGLHEHMALGRLLSRWEDLDPAALGASIAALVARSDEEVQTARRLFEELYVHAAAGAKPVRPPAPAATATRAAWWWPPAAVVAASGLLLVIAVLAGYYIQQAPAAATDYPPPPPPPSVLDGPVEARPPTPPPLPDPPVRNATGAVWQTGLALFLVALAGAWGLDRRRAHRGWRHDSWRRALGALPGPYHLDLRVRGLEARLPRADVEDAAAILGRIYRADERTRELDPGASLRETLRRGLLPTLVFRRVRTARPIVVLQDVGLDMAPWRAKVERLLGDLRRQGVVLERWYFNGDPRRLSAQPVGAQVPLAHVIGLRPDSPVLVVSAGGGLAALGDDHDWLRPFEESERRAWLTPVTDQRLWPPILSAPAVRAWPMSREGLTGAARALAGQETADPVRAAILGEGHVYADDVERLRRLASLVPHPTPEFLEWLRQRFAPDVPDAAVAHVVHAAGASGLPEVRLSSEDVVRLAAATRAETPALERAVRQAIVDALHDSEPAPGSAAHLRWRLAEALQQLHLAALGHGDAARPRAALKELAAGPLWEEVQHAMALVPPDSPARVRDTGPPAGVPALGWAPRPRVAPGIRQLVLASAAAGVLLFVAWQVGAFPAIAFARVENAYDLRLASAVSGESIALELRAAQPSEPAVVDLYRDGALARGGVAIPSGDAARIEIAGGAGSTYQAQAIRPDGNVVQSNPLWVPDADRVVIVIDAQPWANVTISGPLEARSSTPGGAQVVADEATPLRVALRPGRYRVDLENGGVTGPLQRQIDVVPANPAQRFVFPMPGFDPAAAAAAGAATAR
jgi:hypothetical protein